MQKAAAVVPVVPSRRVLPALCLGTSVTSLIMLAPGPFLPSMSDDFGVSVALLGQVVAAMAILSAPLGLVVGPIADRIGARPLIMIGLVAATACFLDFWIAPVFPLLFVASLGGAICAATVPGLSLAIAGVRFNGRAAQRAIGWIIAANATSTVVGIPILTAIDGLAGWRSAFLAAGIATGIITLLVAAWLPADAPERPDAPLRIGAIFGAYPPLLRQAGMRQLYLCTVFRSITWAAMLTYLGAMLSERLGLSLGQIGLTYVGGGGGFFLGGLIAGGPLGRIPARPMVVVSCALSGGLSALMLMATFGTAVTIALMPIVGMVGAFPQVGLTALLASETRAGAGTTMTLNQSLNNAGAAIGAALGGLLLATGGFDGVAYGVLGFGLLSALAVVRRPPEDAELRPATVA